MQRIAVVQAAPVLLDKQASIARAVMDDTISRRL